MMEGVWRSSLFGSGCWESSEKYIGVILLNFENENIMFYR